MKAVGHTDESVQEGGSPAIYAVPLVGSFLTAWALAGSAWLAQEFYGGYFLVNTLVHGLMLWVGFTAARVVTHDAFDPRGFRSPHTPYSTAGHRRGDVAVIGTCPRHERGNPASRPRRSAAPPTEAGWWAWVN